MSAAPGFAVNPFGFCPGDPSTTSWVTDAAASCGSGSCGVGNGGPGGSGNNMFLDANMFAFSPLTQAPAPGGPGGSCTPCANNDPGDYSGNPQYRAMASPSTGFLGLDPTIFLNARKFGLAIRFFYNSNSNADAEFGKARLASVAGYVASTTGTGVITLVRGDFGVRTFTYDSMDNSLTPSTSGGVTTTMVVADGGFTEYYPDGMKVTYQVPSGGNPGTFRIATVMNATGLIHTYGYGSGVEAGLLKTIDMPPLAGSGQHRVTFSYGVSGGSVSLLSGVQDFASPARLWTFQYDANRNLTTVIEPLGCTTKYGYSTAGGAASHIYTIEDPRGFVTTYMYDASDPLCANIT